MPSLRRFGRGPGKRDEMTPQELERLGIAITGSTNWIAPLAKLMGIRNSWSVRAWWTGKVRITSTQQRKLFLLAGQPEAPLSPIFEDTRNRLAQITAMLENGHTYVSIGREVGISPQAVSSLVTRYRRVKPAAELSRVQCPVCSVTFQPKSRNQKSCSKGCGSARWRLLNRVLRQYDAKPCLECGTMFQPKSRREKYCSRRCCNDLPPF